MYHLYSHACVHLMYYVLIACVTNFQDYYTADNETKVYNAIYM